MNSPSERPPRSGLVAFLLALIPGFGHLYVGKRDRGMAVLFFVVTMILLAISRLIAGGVNYVGPAAQAPSDAQLRAAWGVGIVLFICVALVYLWSIWDAVSTAGGRPISGTRVLMVALLAYFVVGWDITQIDLQKMVSQVSNMTRLLSDIVWPWDTAFVQGVARTEAFAYVNVPCTNTLPTEPEEIVGAPFIQVTPTCGDMAGSVQPDGTRNPPGTVLHVIGRGFRPNEEVSAWWEPPETGEFRPRAGGYVVVDADATGAFTLDFNIPAFTIPGGGVVGTASSKITLRQEQQQGALEPSPNLLLALSKIVETIFLGLMATVFGTLVAFPLSFLAARNLMWGNRWARPIYTLVRWYFNVTRSIDPLIWALVFVSWVGLGPFAGTLALAFHTVASSGKLFSEAIENIDEGPLEAIQATGASWFQVVIFGIIPQIIPPFISFTVYRWDFNIRASTILGVVGGGGIGFLLIQWIRLFDFKSAGIAVWLIGIVVMILDTVSTEIRGRFT